MRQRDQVAQQERVPGGQGQDEVPRLRSDGGDERPAHKAKVSATASTPSSCVLPPEVIFRRPILQHLFHTAMPNGRLSRRVADVEVVIPQVQREQEDLEVPWHVKFHADRDDVTERLA
jgi:hypothetical protein